MDNSAEIFEYAFFGPLVVRAGEIEKELKQGVKKPFTKILKVHLGDCHAMGQQPITFIRQVLALVSMPSLLDDPKFPEDVKDRARQLLNECRGYSIGSYTDSMGIEAFRRLVAEYIEKRDGIPSNYGDVFLSAGASDGIKNVLKLLNRCTNGKRPGVMAPIPQYPLYLAALAEFNMHQIGYYLDESKNWALSIEELERAVEEAKSVSHPAAIVVINPGNPTSQVLTRENIEEIIKFAYKEKLFIFADEVYQHNIYAPESEFYSFKKVMTEMGSPYKEMKLASFMSSSKGYMGECGLRGGYAEVINLTPEEKKQLLVSVSALLCPTVIGQIVTACVVNPPKPGDLSYDLYSKEREEVLFEFKMRAKLVAETLNSIPGIFCNEIQGALYAFPRVILPPKAIETAEREGKTPDEFYSIQLLENTGICVVPGKGFGQKPGTHHIRITILPQTEIIKEMLETFRKFHENFLTKYA